MGVKTKEVYSYENELSTSGPLRVCRIEIPGQARDDVCVGMTYDCWGCPVKSGMTYGTGMTPSTGKTMLLSDAKILEDVAEDFVGGDVAGD